MCELFATAAAPNAYDVTNPAFIAGYSDDEKCTSCCRNGLHEVHPEVISEKKLLPS
jgi:hypothetical protein